MDVETQLMENAIQQVVFNDSHRTPGPQQPLCNQRCQILETTPKRKLSEMWEMVHTALLAAWVKPTSRKSVIATKLLNVAKKIKLKNFLAGKGNAAAVKFLNVKPNRLSRNYDGCYVLFLIWEWDNIGGAGKEAEDLKSELEKRWGFFADIYRIPFVEKPDAQQAAVEGAISHFIKHRDGNSNLLFFHYGGHGGLNDKNEYMMFMPNGHGGAYHQFRFGPIRDQFRKCKADVGILVDACFSGAAIDRSVMPHTIEIIAACDDTESTPGVEPHSFTNGVIRVLRYTENTEIRLHELSEELSNLNYPRLRKTPIHSPLTVSLWGSIELQQLDQTKNQDKYSSLTRLSFT